MYALWSHYVHVNVQISKLDVKRQIKGPPPFFFPAHVKISFLSISFVSSANFGFPNNCLGKKSPGNKSVTLVSGNEMSSDDDDVY